MLLKQKITKNIVLAFLDFWKLFEVKWNASVMAIGAILSEEERPIAYFNENLNDAKKKYWSYDKKFYAII